MATKEWIEIIAASTGLLGVGGLLGQRLITGKSIGARAVQFVVAVLMIPTILILGLEGSLSDATIGTLLGGIAGYVLSRVGEFQPRPTGAADD